MSVLRMIAPAKINWSLEVLRARPDGYHEIRSALQTIALHDVIEIEDAADLILEVTGPAGTMLRDAPVESNLAHRAALALHHRTTSPRGARIRLEKHIPVAAGLGGGSSDAAAVLRGLNRLWDAHQGEANLLELAGDIGSDPPFFLIGGTAVASGRGDAVELLRDAVAPSILLAIPPEQERGEKTAAMFEALTPGDFTDGDVTIGVRETVDAGRMLTDGALNNVFERVTTRMQPETERAMDALRAQGFAPHLAGAGPSFFLLYGGGADLAHELGGRVRELGFEPVATHTLSRDRALAMQER